MTPGLPFRIFSLVSLACLLAASAVRLPADEILKTDFADGTVQGWAAYGDKRPAKLEVSTGVLDVSGSMAFRGAYVCLPGPVDLRNGDVLTLSFQVRFPALEPARAGGFRFGLFQPGRDDATGPGDDRGYMASLDIAPSATLSLAQDGGGTAFDPLSGRTRRLASQKADTALSEGEWTEVSLALARTDDITLRITVRVAGAEVSGEVIGSMIPRFGSVYVGSGNNNPRFGIREVRVSRTSASSAP
ncbi:hypothetical protein OpiT1DRAFT_01635 [Opitutaceae bacterium TAV1]|nr:hypothetical protein OpiT1DRAFT_01635 [Opitutaceae bacterium TAV1]